MHMQSKNILRLLLIGVVPLLFLHRLNAQQVDTTTVKLNDQLMLQLELIAENLEENIDFTDLVDTYYYYAENKLNINGPDAALLQEMYLISAFQLEKLQAYIKEYGKLLSSYEILYIEGFDEQTVAIISPLITFEGSQQVQKIKPKNVAKYGRHQLLMRVEDVLEQRQGYQPIEDSALWEKPNSRYLGSSQKLYARYAFNYRNRVRAGITMEKDAGEVFFANNVNDSIRSLLGKQLNTGFDFYSAHFFMKDVGPIRALALGDYHLAFGQGLTMWSGLAFGKSTDPAGVMKFGQGVRPNSSVNESLFLRGAAMTVGWKQFDFTAFYSSKAMDATSGIVDSVSSEVFTISSLQESGLHRTVNELLKKGNIDQEVMGGRFSFRNNFLEIGYTLHQTRLSASLMPRVYPYNQFRFMGNELFNQGVDYRLVFPRLILFGEISRSDNGGLAAIAGFTAQPAGFANITIAYRDYQKEYQNLFSNAFSEGTLSNNERGIYVGLSAAIAPNWKLTAYADHFDFPWLRFATDAPSFGYDYFAQLDHRINRKADLYFRFRTKRKMTNDDDPWNPIDFITPYTKNTYRFHINYAMGDNWILKNRIELIQYVEGQNDASSGYLVFQDVLYRPKEKFYELSMRYTLFQSDSYDSRIYTYENDVLYAFSIPAFSGKGSRAYLMLRLKAHRNIDFWARIAQTWYADRFTIGSGLETIEGKTRTDIKLQMRWKF